MDNVTDIDDGHGMDDEEMEEDEKVTFSFLSGASAELELLAQAG